MNMRRLALIVGLLVLLLLPLSAGAAPLVQVATGTETPSPTPAPVTVPQAQSGAPVVTPVPQRPEEAHDVTFEGKMTVRSDITELDFGQVKVGKWVDVAPFLRQLPNLRKCDIYGTYIRPAQADALAEEFPYIEFGWTFRLGGNGCIHVVRTDQTAFSTLHNIDAYGHDSDEFACLKYCHQMQAIDLGHNRVTDISWLAEMPQVKVLILAVNQIEDISPLAALDLEYLEIFNNYITDLEPLANQTHLKDLNIGFNLIEDFTPLLGLKSLERLWMFSAGARDYRIPVSDANVQMLQDAIPGLVIDNKSTPAQGGWRLHPRYSTIAYIFGYGIYKPFDD